MLLVHGNKVSTENARKVLRINIPKENAIRKTTTVNNC